MLEEYRTFFKTRMTMTLTTRIAHELNISERNVQSVLDLLSSGNTIPFIARYRKDAIGSIDEVKVRDISERMTYLSELEDRKQAILSSIESQAKLNPALKEKILASLTKQDLEDLYLPFKPKRRTRAMMACERIETSSRPYLSSAS